MTAIAMPPVDQAVIDRRSEIVGGLCAIVGNNHVIETEDARRVFETDALNAYRSLPLAVVLPASTEEVARVVKHLADNGVPAVPAPRFPAVHCRRRTRWSSASRA